MTLRLNGTSSGFTEIDAPAAAGSNKITLPTSNGSAEQFLKNSGTAGELEFSSMVETSTGVGINQSSPSYELQVSQTGSGADIAATSNVTSGTASRFILGNSAGTARATFNLTGGGDEKAYLGTEGSFPLFFQTNGAERARFDSSGRLLKGITSGRSVYGIDAGLQIEGTGYDNSSFSLTCNNTSAGIAPYLLFGRSGGNSTGSNTALGSGHIIGEIAFCPADSTNMGSAAVRIQGLTDGAVGENDIPGRLTIHTVPDGSESSVERFRIHSSGKLTVPGVYSGTTTGGGPVYVESDGDLLRYTSSLKYKTDVETIEDARADAILNCRPVWYRSKCENDIKTEGSEKSDWGWYGFIAEEVAEIEPRLVNWATKDGVKQEDGSVESVERDPADYEAEGVRYENFVPLLVNLVKRQKATITAQQAQIDDLLARVTALEAA